MGTSAKRTYDAHPFSDGPTETVEDTTPAQPTITGTIANAVECEYMVYGTFREHFDGMDVQRDYAGTHMYVPTRSGQIVKITIDVLDQRELEAYLASKAP
jgi:hypothetical protein